MQCMGMLAQRKRGWGRKEPHPPEAVCISNTQDSLHHSRHLWVAEPQLILLAVRQVLEEQARPAGHNQYRLAPKFGRQVSKHCTKIQAPSSNPSCRRLCVQWPSFRSL